MAASGIDVSHYQAHSTRGAATSAAARAGVSTVQILKAADGSFIRDQGFTREKLVNVRVWDSCPGFR